MTFKVVVTGATGGIGREIVRGLVHQGATVVIGVRDLNKGHALRTDLAVEPGGGRIEVLPLDLASLESVRAFATEIAAAHPAIQLLINNAGAWFNDRTITNEGHELTLATNLLAPYLLSRLLLPQLRDGAPSRIVNIVSSAVGNYDPGDLDWNRRSYNGFKAYMQSKQALSMATWKLAQRIDGSGVTVNAVSPGFVRTDFLLNAKGVVARLLTMFKFFAVTPAKGARTPLWVALSPELKNANGEYFESGKRKKAKFQDQHPLDELEQLLERMTGLPAWQAASSRLGPRIESEAR
jgi:NAD(P)-dependent dehydrogenase (short-subunit alcohol dehydrogenase family)